MADETPAAPAVEPSAPVTLPAKLSATANFPGFKFGAGHLVGLGAGTLGGTELTLPLMHWVAPYIGSPDVDAQRSLATIAALAATGLGIWFTRGRAGLAAVLNGDAGDKYDAS